jgi:pSer/pThr/pTyr-binding forkhead associated (FHA) protein
MIHLQIDGERYPIAAGETVIGSDASSTVVLAGAGVRPRHAVVQGMQAGAAAIRVADREAEVRVNGVRLGPDPTPLLHGDKIEISGRELLVVDPARAGSTQLFDSGAFADLVPRPGPKGTGTKTGGRLVCLTDGREYTVGAGPLSLGRDAGSDVVVSGNDVSRNHAEIRSEADGYLLLDLSANGTFVNGERIGKTHTLARADVIRIGNDEFRFYAETASPAAPQPAAQPSQPARSPAMPPAGASQQLSDTMHGLPTEPERNTPPGPEAAPLASLLFRSGDFKGRRFAIKVPVVNIGRGLYNDVVISDASVSTMHAKLQRREAIWILSDLGSTNGTFVEGERLTGEAALTPGTTLRFGDVIALFEPLDEHVPAAPTKQTRMMGRIEPAISPKPAVEVPKPAAELPKPVRSRRPIRMVPARQKGPSTVLVTSLLVLLAILVFLLLG